MAQLCRFSAKPGKQRTFILSVKAAMMQHERFRADPKLMARHKVARSEEGETLSLSASITKTLASLRSRFSFFST